MRGDLQELDLRRLSESASAEICVESAIGQLQVSRGREELLALVGAGEVPTRTLVLARADKVTIRSLSSSAVGEFSPSEFFDIAKVLEKVLEKHLTEGTRVTGCCVNGSLSTGGQSESVGSHQQHDLDDGPETYVTIGGRRAVALICRTCALVLVAWA